MKNLYAEQLLRELKEGDFIPSPQSYTYCPPKHIVIEISEDQCIVALNYRVIVNGVELDDYYIRSNRVSFARANEIKNDGVVRVGKAHTRCLERLKQKILNVITKEI